MRKKHHRLRELCRERNLLDQGRELTKREMVQSLLGWVSQLSVTSYHNSRAFTCRATKITSLLLIAILDPV